MKLPEPLETLAVYTSPEGDTLSLPPELARLYGRLEFPPHPGRPYVFGNFVTSLDGVVALNSAEVGSGGGEISGYNVQDRLVMGLLRAIADAVVVGAGTLRAVPDHLWTSRVIYSPLEEAYRELRTSLGKTEPPLNVIVTARGMLDLSLPVFQSGEVPVLVVTSESGARHLREQAAVVGVPISVAEGDGEIRAAAVLEAVTRERACDLILTEGGPQLLGQFLEERLLDELFLTLSPQVTGRDGTTPRPSFVDGKRFAPEQPVWGTLLDIRRSQSHLFLRYAFPKDS
jgi:riboflavin biosynthesis pyrimidine reductase